MTKIHNLILHNKNSSMDDDWLTIPLDQWMWLMVVHRLGVRHKAESILRHLPPAPTVNN